MIKAVIVTGAMGFIGSHTAKVFKQHGYHVIGIDWQDTIPQAAVFLDEWFKEDFSKCVKFITDDFDVGAIIHCAGSSLVGPSIKDPGLYYYNNSAKTNQALCDLSLSWGGSIIFSSTAATYGIPTEFKPLVETDPQQPINPYGWSKLFTEQIIKDHCHAHLFKGIALRYFNAAGCDADGELGHVKNDTHLIPRILTCYQEGWPFNLFGANYKTLDGSCVRDYLHVTDIANAHLAAVQLAETMNNSEFRAYNLGTGHGWSNKEVIRACSDVVGERIDYRIDHRREGDPDYLVADSTRFQTDTNWRPVNSNLDHIVETAWRWQKISN